jgi:PIN domain nuclease of toxin-antitoxin system
MTEQDCFVIHASFWDIGFRQIMRCASLPWRHHDPFDRLLIAQAQEKSLPIVSRNAAFDVYGIKRF